MPTHRRLTRLLVLLLIATTLTAVLAPAGSAGDATSTAPTTGPAVKIKVGVLVSRFTAEGPSWTDKPYGWGHAAIARRLKADALEVYPVVDPDTAADEGVLRAVGDHFPAGAKARIIDGADADRLAGLDVIVAQRVWNLEERALEPLVKAISGGVSLVNIGAIGVVTPGFSPAVNPLNAMGDDATYAWHPREQAAEFVGGIKLELEPKPQAAGPEGAAPAAALKLKPNGAMGSIKPGTVPLMQLAPGADGVAFPERPAPAGTVFYPLLFGELEKGRIFQCNMYGVSQSVDRAAGGNFVLKAVQAMAKAKAPR